MSACDQLQESLHAMADGEIAGSGPNELQEHLAACHSCARDLTAIRAVKRVFGDRFPQTEAPEHLRIRLETIAAEWQERRAGRYLRGGQLRWLAASVFLAFLVVGLWLVQRPGEDGPARVGADRAKLFAQMVEDHVRLMSQEKESGVVSDDPSIVAEWFSQRLPFEVRVPNLWPEAKLQGGRLCRLEGRAVALLSYRRGEDKLSMYVVKDDPSMAMLTPEGADRDCHLTIVDNRWLFVWRSDGVAYALVSELSESDTLQIGARALRGRARQKTIHETGARNTG